MNQHALRPQLVIYKEVQIFTDIDILSAGLSYAGFDAKRQGRVNLTRNMKRYKQFFGGVIRREMYLQKRIGDRPLTIVGRRRETMMEMVGGGAKETQKEHHGWPHLWGRKIGDQKRKLQPPPDMMGGVGRKWGRVIRREMYLPPQAPPIQVP
jgi:hypothetical protein